MRFEKPSMQQHAGKSLLMAFRVTLKEPKELAEFLGVSRQNISRMQSSKRMSDDRIAQIAKFFGMSVNEFFDLSTQPMSAVFHSFFSNVLETCREVYPEETDERTKQIQEMTHSAAVLLHHMRDIEKKHG